MQVTGTSHSTHLAWEQAPPIGAHGHPTRKLTSGMRGPVPSANPAAQAEDTQPSAPLREAHDTRLRPPKRQPSVSAAHAPQIPQSSAWPLVGPCPVLPSPELASFSEGCGTGKATTRGLVLGHGALSVATWPLPGVRETVWLCVTAGIGTVWGRSRSPAQSQFRGFLQSPCASLAKSQPQCVQTSASGPPASWDPMDIPT